MALWNKENIKIGDSTSEVFEQAVELELEASTAVRVPAISATTPPPACGVAIAARRLRTQLQVHNVCFVVLVPKP